MHIYNKNKLENPHVVKKRKSKSQVNVCSFSKNLCEIKKKPSLKRRKHRVNKSAQSGRCDKRQVTKSNLIEFKDANSLLNNALGSSKFLSKKSACMSFKINKNCGNKLNDQKKLVSKSRFFVKNNEGISSKKESLSVSSKDNNVNTINSYKASAFKGPSDKSIKLFVNGVRLTEVCAPKQLALSSFAKVDYGSNEDLKPVNITISPKEQRRETCIKFMKEDHLANYKTKQNENLKKQELMEDIRKYLKETKIKEAQRKIDICNKEECTKVFSRAAKQHVKSRINSITFGKLRSGRSKIFDSNQIRETVFSGRCVFSNPCSNSNEDFTKIKSDQPMEIMRKSKKLRIRKINRKRARVASPSPLYSPFSVVSSHHDSKVNSFSTKSNSHAKDTILRTCYSPKFTENIIKRLVKKKIKKHPTLKTKDITSQQGIIMSKFHFKRPTSNKLQMVMHLENSDLKARIKEKKSIQNKDLRPFSQCDMSPSQENVLLSMLQSRPESGHAHP